MLRLSGSTLGFDSVIAAGFGVTGSGGVDGVTEGLGNTVSVATAGGSNEGTSGEGGGVGVNGDFSTVGGVVEGDAGTGNGGGVAGSGDGTLEAGVLDGAEVSGAVGLSGIAGTAPGEVEPVLAGGSDGAAGRSGRTAGTAGGWGDFASEPAAGVTDCGPIGRAANAGGAVLGLSGLPMGADSSGGKFPGSGGIGSSRPAWLSVPTGTSDGVMGGSTITFGDPRDGPFSSCFLSRGSLDGMSGSGFAFVFASGCEGDAESFG